MSVRPEVVLLVGAAAVGLLALLFPLLLRRNDPIEPVPWSRLAVAAGVIALLFALTRLRVYPFSPGGTLGQGLVLGGAVALLTAAMASSWPGTAATTVGASGGALLGVAVILLWHRGYPNAALAGFAAGHAVATLLAVRQEDEGWEPEPVRHSGLWAGPVMAALIAGAALLAIFRAGEMRAAERLALDGKVWWAWPAALMAVVLAGQMVGLSLFARRALAPAAAGLVAALLLLLLWLRFPLYAPLLAPAAAGFVTALLLLPGVQALRRSGVQGRTTEALNAYASTPERLNAFVALVAPLLALLLLAGAYRLYTGYGIALAALGAAVLLPWLAEQEPRSTGRAFFGLLTAAILFRVYYHSYDLHGADIPLTAHYSLIGLIAGALAPWAWGIAYGTEGEGQRARVSLPFALVSLLLAAALPLLLALFWGQKSGGGLLLGLAIGQAYRMMAALLEADVPGPVGAVAARVPEAAALVTAWVTVQLLDRAAAYGQQLLRIQRVGLIAALVVLCFLVILYRAWRRPGLRTGP